MIQDGIGDRPIALLGGKTPLEAARTPYMDSLIRRGSAGLMDILGPGITVGTDIGHLELFGQDTRRKDFRRGPMEAVGAGVDLAPDEIAVRFNFATLDGSGRILDRRAGRIREGAKELVAGLNTIPEDPPFKVRFYHATEHRGAVVFSGPSLSAQISDTDPGDLSTGSRILDCKPLAGGAEPLRAAQLLNRVVRQSQEVLRRHPVNLARISAGQSPANGILTRGAGTRPVLTSLPAQLGLRMACVSGESTVLGIARLAGLDNITTPQMTSNLDTNFDEKAKRTLEALAHYDIVYLHLKGCDIAGHDRQPELKRDFIESTDQMLGTILERLDNKDYYIACLGDHATLAESGEHSGDPVPAFVSGPGIPADDVRHYGESYCSRGALGRLLCRDLLARLFSYLVPDVFKSSR